jgi:hypothetical protein
MSNTEKQECSATGESRRRSFPLESLQRIRDALGDEFAPAPELLPESPASDPADCENAYEDEE